MGAFALGLGAAALGTPQVWTDPTKVMPTPTSAPTSAVDAAETAPPVTQPPTDPLLPQDELPQNFERTERQDAEARRLIDETARRAQHPPARPYHPESGNATWQPQFTIRDGRVEVSPVDPAASNNSDKTLNSVPPSMGPSVDYPFERDPTLKTGP